jgi:hypothetical protein
LVRTGRGQLASFAWPVGLKVFESSVVRFNALTIQRICHPRCLEGFLLAMPEF